MADESRSEANLKHFQSRTANPNVWNHVARSQTVAHKQTASDQGFMSHIDDLRFKYLGTSPAATKSNTSAARRVGQSFMGEKA